jgi:uncharacterized protein YgbK (DUF1537 family)
MKEADIRLILAEQTKLPVELVDVLKLENARARWLGVPGSGPDPIILFDTLSKEHLPVIGEAITDMGRGGQLFVVGSSGVEYALTSYWRGRGVLGTAEEGGRGEKAEHITPCSPHPPRPPSSAVNQILAVSGSCSPVTDRQIEAAIQSGFAEFALHPKRLVSPAYKDAIHVAASLSLQSLEKTKPGILFHTSRGPGDKRLVRSRKNSTQFGEELGAAIGKLLETLLEVSSLRRAVVCGGDTSMHVARALGIEALEYLGPMAPGSPLCKVHAPGRVADGCEIVFKGGQVGRDRFFLDVLNGGPVTE